MKSMKVSDQDRSILRGLAEQQAVIASLSVNKERITEWTRLNGLGKGRPLVWINDIEHRIHNGGPRVRISEIPWHEMNVNGELDLQATDAFCRAVEQQFRRRIYTWNHMQLDMVVEPTFYSPLVIHDTGFGIRADVDVVRLDEETAAPSRRFHPQIIDERDLDKIQDPVVTHDEEASEVDYEALVNLFGDILRIEKRGIVSFSFAPWDQLIQWWGVQEALQDLVLRPELVHQAMDRLVSAQLVRLQQWRDLNLLSFADGNYRVGSGGLGYSDELPREDFDAARVRSIDQWGHCTAQIFSAVSPRMHEEFALQYERRWLAQCGLAYYGCCEPLHDKMEILKSIPNLRKISMSAWADIEKTVDRADGKYVLSFKPNPNVFATDSWNPARVRKELSEALDKATGCAVEVLMKDMSTVRYKPQRLWEWCEIAMDVATG